MVLPGFFVLTLLGLWIVGARNRLTRLRHQLFKTLTPLGQQLRKRHALGQLLAESARRLPDVPRHLVEAVVASQRQAVEALNALNQRPRLGGPLVQVGAAEQIYGQALTQLVATLPEADTPAPASPSDASVHEWRHRLQQLHPPLDYARSHYNSCAQTYNAALRQFPTRLIAALFRLAPAPVVPRVSSPD